jgi:catechol 2,3-dioxygenase-like lactoylglutathione lyase family enzyme
MTQSFERAGATLIVTLALWTNAAVASTDGPAAQPLIAAVESIAMTVSDLDRAAAFYSDILSFEKVDEMEAWGEAVERLYGVFGARVRVARLRLGEEMIELTEVLTPPGRPMPVDSRGNDRWFQHIAIVVNDMDRAYERLRRHKVRHSSPAPQRLPDWNKNAGGIRAFYFRDPDGHFLELLQFPTDKGDPKWRRPTDRLFLGIDHTAIVVADTDASLRLYRDLLGMKVVGHSENHGPEQERLNNVFGARLRITTLRAGAGPGIELLEYLAPTDGRPAPADLRANDVAHWHVRLTAPSVASAMNSLQKERVRVVSSNVNVEERRHGGALAGLMARDPDGHAFVIAGGQSDAPASSAALLVPSSSPADASSKR